MSKFSLSSISTFKNFKTQPIELTNKISQKELKKKKNANKINPNPNPNSQVSDLEFEKLMEENDNQVYNSNYKNCLFLDKIPNPNDITELTKNILETGLKGDDLVNYLENQINRPNGIEFLNGLLYNKINSSEINWLVQSEYGLALKHLFDNDLESQFLCLLMVQNYSKSLSYPKVEYKNSQKYLIRLLFQLLFTSEIIDESVYSRWENYLSETNEIDESEKKTLLIQTTEFLMIFNTTFNDEDYENENENTNENNNQYGKNINYTQNEENIEDELEKSVKSKDSDEDSLPSVPEEQDYNLDDL
jgi:hypothetical protein